MQKNLIKIAVATALGLVALTAAAEDMYRGAWYAVPGASYMSTDSDLEAKNGGGAFIRLGKELSPKWDIQTGLSYNRANDDIAGSSGHYKQTTFGVDALYMLSRDSFRPFLLTGLGVAHNNVDYSIPTIQDKTKTSWLANIGVGAQYLINDSFGLQADIRQQWSRSNAKAPSTTFDADGIVGNTLVNLGGIFRFGAPTPMPVAQAEPEAAPAPVEPAPAPAVVEAEPAPAPVAAAEACQPSIETITISAEKLFGFDKSKLQDGAKPILDGVVAKIKANPEIELIMVTGHTDRLGSDAYNQKLSERRANQVKAYLVAQGVDAKRLKATGKGESEPVVACEGVKASKELIACLQPNRRVVISASSQREVGCH